LDTTTGIRQKPAYYLAALVSLLAFVIYLPSLWNEFVGWDDGTYVVSNPFIRSLNGALLKWAFFDFHAANWHPLTWISHAVDYAVWGLNPMGHHLTNNILHAVNTFLVVLLVVRLTSSGTVPILRLRSAPSVNRDSPLAVGGRQSAVSSQPSNNDSTTQQLNYSPYIVAGTTGLLFGLHPIHVESVAWVAERKDLLCALFYLLSVMAYAGYVTLRQAQGDRALRQPQGDRALRQPQGDNLRHAMVSPSNHFNKPYLLTLAFFILALMSKPMAVSLPVVLLILDWYPFNRITSLKTFMSSLAEKIPFIALSIGSAVITILAQKAGGAVVTIEAIPLPTRILVAARAIIAYLWKMLMPLDLLPLYPYPRDVSLLSPEFLGAVVLVSGITLASAAVARKKKLWLSAWLYYVVTLLPVLGIVQVGSQPMADRYTYLTSLSPFLIAGIIAAGTYERMKISRRTGTLMKSGSIMAAAVVLAAMSYATVRQIGVWKDGVALWNYVIEKEPLRVPRAYTNGGLALMEKGRKSEAIEYLQIAIQLESTNPNAHNNLGLAYKSKGDYDRAIEEFLAAISLRPDDPEIHNNLGVAYRYKGMFDKAIEQYQIALSLKPEYAEAHFNLGIIYLETGDVDAARKEFEAGLKIRPDDRKARQILNEITSR
jgi:tetratricopeptide (TPR) repeat protein